ncbi:MAG: PIN domain-containing protein [Aliihoeflea sp.]|uniref:PIN domain-containing protein n=1 Tax=Aliihoeflea sp. TaxID=2608088 RepID=UPI0040383861
MNDHPSQSEIAHDLLASLDEERRGYVGISAVLEIFWVLRSRYRVPRQPLCETMRELLMIKYLDIESSAAVVQALAMYQKGRVDFEDALLAERNVEADCGFTYTFDRAASKAASSMELLTGASRS